MTICELLCFSENSINLQSNITFLGKITFISFDNFLIPWSTQNVLMSLIKGCVETVTTSRRNIEYNSLETGKAEAQRSSRAVSGVSFSRVSGR